MFGLKKSPQIFPSATEVAYLNMAASRTPDIVKLEESEFQLFFFGDDMRRNCLRYPVIAENSAFVTLAFTQKKFNFYLKQERNQALPIPLEVQEESGFVRNAIIFGELHLVESSHVMKLDEYRLNGEQFLRKRVKILIPNRKIVSGNHDEDGRELPPALQGKEKYFKGILTPERVDLVSAWMYTGIHKYWDDLIDGGYTYSQVKVRQPMKEKAWLTEYYDITK